MAYGLFGKFLRGTGTGLLSIVGGKEIASPGGRMVIKSVKAGNTGTS